VVHVSIVKVDVIMGGGAKRAANTCGVVGAYDGNVAGSRRCKNKNKIRACSFSVVLVLPDFNIYFSYISTTSRCT
jgi:hypothetical protein